MAPASRGSSQQSDTRLSTICRKPDKSEMTNLWHRHRGPRRTRCSCVAVEALLPVLASSRGALWHWQECTCAIDVGPCAKSKPVSIARSDTNEKAFWCGYPGINPNAKFCRFESCEVCVQYSGLKNQRR